jgi:hypothetical protein
MVDELPTTPKSPPSPPSNNGDRLDRSPDRLVEAKAKNKRRMSDKQLENLRKGREAGATKGKAKLEPQAPEPPAPEPQAPDPKSKPKPKPRAKPQPKTQTTPIMEPATLNFSVL